MRDAVRNCEGLSLEEARERDRQARQLEQEARRRRHRRAARAERVVELLFVLPFVCGYAAMFVFFFGGLLQGWLGTPLLLFLVVAAAGWLLLDLRKRLRSR